MIRDSLLKAYNVPEENMIYLRSSWILEDLPLLETLLKYAGNCETQNPYYKYIEIVERVKACDKVYIQDLETLDDYYKMNLVKKFLSDPVLSENYTGGAFKQKRQLASYLKGRYSRFDYVAFHNFLSALN